MFLRELSSIMRPAVFAFGRMNPPTTGHQQLVDVMLGIKGDHYLFLSHTQSAKKDPLDFETKVKYAKKFFPKVEVGHKSVKTIIDALKLLEKKGYTAVTFVAGSDRIIQFSDLIKKYNGKEYNFDSIEFVSAGERDADSDDVNGMSASKIRAAAADGNFEGFSKGIPVEDHAKHLYNDVRKGMQINEADTLMGEKDPVIVVYDAQGKPVDRLLMSVAAQKYRFNVDIVRPQFAQQDKVKVGQYTLSAPIAGQPIGA